MLIYNNTRVINARLKFRKSEGGATIEIFCLEPELPRDYAQNFAATESCTWLCMIGNSKRWKSGDLTMQLGDVTLVATRLEKLGNSSLVKFSWNSEAMTFSDIISAAGEIPIPPYLNRNTESCDSSDYQTVYSHIEGSVAAPTAGLHFTDRVLAELDKMGIERRELTLHVGAGTFQPVKSDNIGDHAMHSEFIAVSRELICELSQTTKKVIAVGTTSVRTLESLYHIGCMMSQNNWEDELDQWYPYSTNHPNLSVQESLEQILAYLDSNHQDTLIAATRVMIAPGYKYRIVDGIVTNFHQPKSTLLLLVSAKVDGKWKEIYQYALDNNFRFLSYGDACLLL
jgi:S-adenosylmethionine:tRNA ribosyltransferase-isomerase